MAFSRFFFAFLCVLCALREAIVRRRTVEFSKIGGGFQLDLRRYKRETEAPFVFRLAKQGHAATVSLRSPWGKACLRNLSHPNLVAARGTVLERGDVYNADASEVAELIQQATKCRVERRYIGPVFISPAEPTADDLTHPEHGNQGFPAGQVCAVVYQRNIYAEEREQRVRD